MRSRFSEGTYRCSFCDGEISLDDVNVAKDLVLCRTCGKAGPFSALAGKQAFAKVDLSRPPKHVRIQDAPGGRRRIVYRKFSFSSLFLLPFTLIWSGGSLGGIYGSQLANNQFDPKMSLFGLPFVIGTIVLVSVTLHAMFGRTVVEMHRGQGRVFVGVGPLGWSRRFAYARGGHVELELSSVRRNRRRQTGIAVYQGTERRILFGTMLDHDGKNFMAAWMQQRLNEA